MTTIAENLHQVRERIARACIQSGRDPQSVTLLAVSKTFASAAVREAFSAGQAAFGENYIQEAVEKIQALEHLHLQWHCIGPIQSNKTRLVAEHFQWAHTVDRLKIAQRLSDQRPKECAPLQVCVQVNVDAGVTKSGVAPSEALSLARAVAALPGLRLHGFMCIPEPATNFVAACAIFAKAKALFDQCNDAGMELDTLSMGMSDDLEAAIASGSTLVRVGRAVFGQRSYATVAT